MAGKLTFQIAVYQTNTAVLPELENRARNLSPLFEDIIDEWAELNKQKFEMSEGGEESGSQIDPTVFWQPLSPGYLKEKRKHYPTDTLMVRTGSLKDAMTTPNGFFRMVNPEQAVFGTPNDAEDALKVQFNWNKRQVIFLSDADQNMIRMKLDRYFTVEMQSVKEEVARLDTDFSNTVG